jgi:TetR/AcrR family transcriptional regulator, mexJK operon transcriptional repressor
MGAAASEIRKGRKYDQVLDGARTVFLRDGFEGASVDDIAREAGVSKATLYSYFPDKRLLFMEVAKGECRRQAEEAEALIDDAAPVAQVLRLAAERMTGFLMSEFGQRMFRLCVAESDRFPALGDEFYESGPRLIRERLSRYLQQAQARGEVKIDDLGLAADQFSQLCKAGIFDCVMFGRSDGLSDAAIKRTLNGAIEMFMARYGVNQR